MEDCMSKETVAEFVARGGKITKVEAQKSEDHYLVKSTVVSPPKLYPLGHTVLSNPPKKKKKPKTTHINWDLIPPEFHNLRIEEKNGEENNPTPSNGPSGSTDGSP